MSSSVKIAVLFYFNFLNATCSFFSVIQFTEHGIEGVVPFELLPPDVRSKYQAKPSERSKRAKKEDTKSTAQPEENQVNV